MSADPVVEMLAGAFHTPGKRSPNVDCCLGSTVHGIVGMNGSYKTHDEAEVAHRQYHLNDATKALAASPELRECIELGMAWKACKDALPEGWLIEMGNDLSGVTIGWYAEALRPAPQVEWRKAHIVEGATPAEALNNLAALLRATEKPNE
jgi:hypothetical protein